MSQLPRYESYKDSGVQWLGEIPSHWDVKRMKFVVANVGDKIDAKESDLRYFGLENIESFTGKLLDSVELESEGIGHRFQKDDVLFGKLRPYLAKVFLAQEEGLSSTEALVFRSSEVIYPKFLSYYCLSQDFINEVNGTTFGSKMPRASWDDISSFRMVYPSLDEQKFIADFLDKRLAQVDALIVKQETLLEKLAEQRVALISHAVTKGLNPTVEMKKTGIKWIGDIPKHWKIMGLKKSLASIVDYRGKTPEKVEQGVFLVTARNIKNGFIDYSLSKEYVEKDLYLDIMSRGLPEIGDVLLTTEAPLGEIAQIDKTDIALAQRIIKFRGKKDVINNTFLKYFMLSRSFQDSLYTYSSGSTAIGIKAERLSYLKVAVPPLEEQEIISNFIAEGVHDIDGMVDKVHQTIQVLREYRSTLITQVVTGKIDVRNLKVN